MCKNVILIGASGHGKVIADIIEKSGDKVFGFLDDNENLKSVMNYKVLGTSEKCIDYPECEFIISIGNNKIRKMIAEKYPNLKYYTAVHPSAVIANGVRIGEGTCVMANAVINAAAEIGRHCIINTGAVIEHDNKIGDYVHVSPKGTLCGTVTVGNGTHIGAGATVKNNVNIAADTIIGAGAVVIKDIEKSGTYAGVPVRELV